jgi:hypothetical protein
MPANPILTAFGETKRASEWQKDERCKVGIDSLYRRVKELEWPVERAITEPLQVKVDTNGLMDDLKIGDVFWHFTFSGGFKSIRYKRCAKWECVCGKILWLPISVVINGSYKSCGCKKGEGTGNGIKSHGLSRSYNGKKHPLYSIWSGMQDRCTNENNPSYQHYGGRGIRVEFLDFFDFYNWSINNGWEVGLTIDRRENDGNYSVSNCRWTTMKVQGRNKRSCFMITAFGETKCLIEWSEDVRCTVRPQCLSHRIKKLKWDAQKAITTKLCRK